MTSNRLKPLHGDLQMGGGRRPADGGSPRKFPHCRSCSSAQAMARAAFLLGMTSLLLSGCDFGDQSLTQSSPAKGDFLEKTAEKGPVKLIVWVTPKQPRLSDLVEVDVQVVGQPGVEIKPPMFGQAVGDFLVRDYGERGSVRPSAASSDVSNTRHFRYQLEPVHAGIHLIRSISIEFVDNREESEQKGTTSLIESEPIEINVTSELGDQVPNLANLEPMLPPRPVDQSSNGNWLYAMIVLVVAVVGVIWFRRRRKSSEAELPKQTPQEIAHAAFKALLSENLPARGQFKEFYLRLTGIVRRFIEGTTGLRAPEQTTEEFLAAIGSRRIFSANQSVRLKEFLEAADMVKYAGQQPDQNQIELSISRAREFVDFQAASNEADVHDSPVQQEA